MKGLFVSLLLTGLCQAVRVYLHPDVHTPPRLPANQAGAVLSKHLNLERFEEPSPTFGEQELVLGQGVSAGLLLSINQEDAKAIVPSSLKKSTFTISSGPTPDSLSALIPTYIDRAHHVYSYVYERPPHTTDALKELSYLKDFLEGDYNVDRFGAFDFTSISALKKQLGAEHEQVHKVHKVLHKTLESMARRSDIQLAIVSIPTHSKAHGKRQPQQSPLPPPLPRPAEPIDSISTCYDSVETCGNATSACSGHGECVQASKAGKTCFVCACSATTDKKGRKEHWAGNACERKDVSGPFVLLAGTTITLLLLVGGSVALLSGIGDQKLPSTLAGSVSHSSR